VALQRPVALKMILAGGQADVTQVLRFLSEAEIIAQLQHPHIIGIYEMGKLGVQPYFSLELCPGGSLATHIKGEPQEPHRAAEWMVQLANGIAFAHQAGVIHRDLKPANVLIAADGTLKITDFGLAKHAASHLTATNDVFGTPNYMAPEQTHGAHAVGPAADIWALGATLYELLTGRPPFKGTSVVEVLTQVLSVEPVAVRDLAPGCPVDLQTICHKCLQKDPARRYGSAAELATDLRAFLAGQPVKARPIGWGERWVRWCRREPALAAALSILAVVLIGSTVGALGLARWALQNAADARHHAASARQTVRDLLVRFSADERLRSHDLEAVRRDFLLLAKQRLEGLLPTLGANPELRAELGDTLFRLAHLTEELDTPEAALSYYEQARTVFARLHADWPQVAGHTAALALTQHNLGILYKTLGRQADALAAHQTAQQLRERLRTDQPEVPDYQAACADTHNELGLLARAAGDYATARTELLAAHALYTQLAADHPTERSYGLYLAGILTNLGALSQDHKHYAEAETALTTARARWLALLEHQPTQPRYQAGYALVQHTLAVMYANTRRVDLAEHCARAAQRMNEDLLARHPQMLTYRSSLVEALQVLVTLARRHDRWDETAKLLTQVVEQQAALVAARPNVVPHRADWAEAWQELAELHTNQGDLPAAIRAYEFACQQYRLAALQAPFVAAYRTRYAYCLTNLGGLYPAKHSAFALRAYQQSEALLAALVRQHPEQSQFVRLLGFSQVYHGRLLLRRDQPQAAVTILNDAIERLRGVSATNDHTAEVRGQLFFAYRLRATAWEELDDYGRAAADLELAVPLANAGQKEGHQVRWAYALARARQTTAAVTTARALGNEPALTPAQWYDLACVWAVCATAEANETWATQAVQTLDTAILSGYSDELHVRTDRDWAGLRQRPDFLAVLNGLGYREPAPLPRTE
jgi:tetratricopeptide (TPR) repeat protein